MVDSLSYLDNLLLNCITSLSGIETWTIYGLNITLAAPRKGSFDSLEYKYNKYKGRKTTTCSQHENSKCGSAIARGSGWGLLTTDIWAKF